MPKRLGQFPTPGLRGRIDRVTIQAWQGLRRRVLKLVRWRSSRKAAAMAALGTAIRRGDIEGVRVG